MKKKAKKAPPPLVLKVGAYFVRKRDKMLVSIYKLSQFRVEYTTHPLLEVWPTSRDSFVRTFRPATQEEIDHEEKNK